MVLFLLCGSVLRPDIVVIFHASGDGIMHWWVVWYAGRVGIGGAIVAYRVEVMLSGFVGKRWRIRRKSECVEGED